MSRHNQSPIVTINQEIIIHCSKPKSMSRKQKNVLSLGPFLVTILLLTPYNFFSLKKIVREYYHIINWSTRRFKPSPPPFPCKQGHPCLGVRTLRLEMSSLTGGIQVFYLKISRCFKVMSSLSPANGSEEKVYKVQVLKLGQYVESHGRWFNFAFYKKMWPLNSAFEKDIWTQFWLSRIAILATSNMAKKIWWQSCSGALTVHKNW